MKKAISQEDSFGCGIACVAWITDESYKQAKKRYFKNSDSASTFGYLCKELVAALAKAKKQYGYRYVKRRLKFRNDSIVFIKRSKRYPAGHYLVRTNDGWMDPWINFNYRDADIRKVKAGFRKRLPGKPIYVVFPNAQYSRVKH